MTLDTQIGRSGLPGAGVLARKGPRLGIRSVRDLLFDLPRRYEDRREIATLGEIARGVQDGERATAQVRVSWVRMDRTMRRRVQRTTAAFADPTGEAEAVWFGRRGIEKRLHEGDEILVTGRVKRRGYSLVFENPEFATVNGDALSAGRIVPVYRLTEGVTVQRLRATMRAALDAHASRYPEYLPREAVTIRSETDAVALPIARALNDAHFPESNEDLERALRRLAFDELLALQVGMVARDRARRREAGERVVVTDSRFGEAIAIVEGVIGESIRRRRARLGVADEGEPVSVGLTVDQRAALEAIRADLAASRPMMRLLQGDVGSGKTAVAALALAFVADAGRQGALLAPTDLLARQHAQTLTGFLEPLGYRVELLTGSLGARERASVTERLANGPVRGLDGLLEGAIVVGTHALISEKIRFAHLGLAVVDEQHRFGVAQREALRGKGSAPHVLLMTATPIPGTLGQILHADLDVSDLRTPPAGRTPIRTGIRRSDQLESVDGKVARGAWPLVVREVEKGHRAFVVVPLVEDDEGSGARAAGSVAEELSETLPRITAELAASEGRSAPERRIRVGVVHGQMPAADRDREMDAMRRGDVDVLVGTTVIEVGVDVPEATVIVILDADRFGVAQLHQLRGRVGRGDAQSWCVLVSDAADETAMERLHALETRPDGSQLDGFELAEKDLELRREGELLGFSQSGLPPLRVASLQRLEDRRLSKLARKVAEQLVDDEGRLRPGHDALLAEMTSGWLARVGAGEALNEIEAEMAAEADAADPVDAELDDEVLRG